MPDAAGQPEGEFDLESHLETLLGEIESTQHGVEARSPETDQPTSEPVAEPADRADEPQTVEPRSAQDQTLDVLSEVEADLDDLMEAISELGNPSLEYEPPIESRAAEPETAPEAVTPAPGGDVVAEADAAPPESSGDLQDMIADGTLGEVGSLDDQAPQTESREPEGDATGVSLDELSQSVEQMVRPEPAENTPAADAAPPASAPAASGDSLDDLLAAASEELLADEATNPASLDTPEPEAIAPAEAEEHDANQEVGAELMDAAAQLGESADLGDPSEMGDSSEMGDPAEAIAGMVEIPDAPAAPSASAPEGEATPGVESAEPSPAAEPTQTTVEELIVARPEPSPPTGRLAPLIIAWRATRRTLTPVARAAATHAGPALAEAALAVSKPLREKPKSIRDTVGWIALYTAFLAMCLWVFALGFRSPDPKEVGDSGVRVINPDVPSAPVP